MNPTKCPKCGTRVIAKSLDGKVRIRTNIVAFDQHGAEIVCKNCKTTMHVDLELGESLRKALEQNSPRLVVRMIARKDVDTSETCP